MVTFLGISYRGYKFCELFGTEFGHIFVVSMEDKRGHSIAIAIKRYFEEIGLPLKFLCDQEACLDIKP